MVRQSDTCIGRPEINSQFDASFPPPQIEAVASVHVICTRIRAETVAILSTPKEFSIRLTINGVGIFYSAAEIVLRAAIRVTGFKFGLLRPDVPGDNVSVNIVSGHRHGKIR